MGHTKKMYFFKSTNCFSKNVTLLFSEALEHRSEEVGRLKKDLRLKDETIQQREIEISCLRGQVILRH